MERPRTPRTILRASALAAALAVSGCALTLSGPDPKRSRDRVPQCDTTKGFVVSDGIIGSALGVTTLAALGDGAGTVALVPASIAALFFLSAARGNGVVNDCRAAIAAYEEREMKLVSDELDDEDDTPRARPPVRRSPPRAVTTPPAAGRGPRAAPGPAPTAPPAVAPPVTAPPVTAPPVAAPPVAAPPVTAPPVAAPPAAPAAPPAKAAPATPPAKAPPPPAAPPPPPPSTWVDFWRELP